MSGAQEIEDSTDWLNTPLTGFSSVENALHCQICKEFFDTPMITSCCHTFCSKCIRFALSSDGCCPACRTQDQASKLRNNWQIQELVTTFLAARPVALKVAREHEELLQSGRSRPGKRKRSAVETGEKTQEVEGRSLRSKTRRTENPHPSQTSYSEAASDKDYVDDIEEVASPVDDGLVECPLGCGIRMKIEEVEPHLDRCEDERKARETAEARIRARANDSRMRERLSEPNYSMMKERDLARKLKDQGLSSLGTKQHMARRYTAWVNIWNANCDSSRPRNKTDLKRDLDSWEKAQGAGMATHDQGVMKKEFDGSGWMKKNQNDFSQLIQSARESRRKAAAMAEDSNSSGNDTEATDEQAVPFWQREPPPGTGSPGPEIRKTAELRSETPTISHIDPPVTSVDPGPLNDLPPSLGTTILPPQLHTLPAHDENLAPRK